MATGIQCVVWAVCDWMIYFAILWYPTQSPFPWNGEEMHSSDQKPCPNFYAFLFLKSIFDFLLFSHKGWFPHWILKQILLHRHLTKRGQFCGGLRKFHSLFSITMLMSLWLLQVRMWCVGDGNDASNFLISVARQFKFCLKLYLEACKILAQEQQEWSFCVIESKCKIHLSKCSHLHMLRYSFRQERMHL